MAVFHGGAVSTACSTRREAENARCSFGHKPVATGRRQAQPDDNVVSRKVLCSTSLRFSDASIDVKSEVVKFPDLQRGSNSVPRVWPWPSAHADL